MQRQDSMASAAGMNTPKMGGMYGDDRMGGGFQHGAGPGAN